MAIRPTRRDDMVQPVDAGPDDNAETMRDRLLTRGVRTTNRPVRDLPPLAGAPEPVEGDGFLQTAGNAFMLSPVIQAVQRASEQFEPMEGYDPFANDMADIQGYERYALYFAGAVSPEDVEHRKSVIDANTARHESVEQGSLWGALAGYLMRPESIATLGISLPAVGVRAGAVRWGGFGAGFVAAEEALGRAVDPTHPDGSIERIAMGGIITSLFGGAVGGVAGRIAASQQRTVRQLADDLAADMVADIHAVERRMVDIDTGFTPNNQPGIWRAQATTAEWDGRPAFAFGLDRIASTDLSAAGIQSNPFYNAWADLVREPHRGVHDLANAFGNEFGMAFRYNELGQTAELSAFLRSRQWLPKWSEVDLKIQEAWSRHIGHPDPRRVMGLSPTTLAARARDRIGQALGRRPDNGKMTFHEFKSALFRAHDEESLSRFDPETRKLLAETRAQAIQPVMREIGEELERVGALGTPRGMQNRLRILQEQRDHFTAVKRDLDVTIRQEPNERGDMVDIEVPNTPQAQVQLQLINDRLREVARQMRGLERRMFGTRGLGAVGDAQPGATGATVTQPGREGFAMPPAASDNWRASDPAPLQEFEIKPFVDGEARFDPPANEPGIVVDKWEDRRGSLEPTGFFRPRLTLPPYETGKPVVADVFHGTSRVFDAHDPAMRGEATNAPSAREGFFFARNPETTRTYSDFDVEDQFFNFDAVRIDDYRPGGARYDALDEAVEARRQQLSDPPSREEAHQAAIDMIATLKAADEDAFDRMMRSFVEQAEEDPIITFLLDETFTPISPNTRMERVRFENPMVKDFKGGAYREASYSDLIREAKEAGHDGAIFLNTFDGGPMDVIYVAFDPDQIRFRFDADDFAARREITDNLNQLHGRGQMPSPANDDLPRIPDGATRTEGGFNVPGAEPQRIDMTPANDAMPSMLDTNYLPRMWNHQAVLDDIADGIENSRLFQIARGEYRKAGKDLTEREFRQIVDGILTGNPVLEIGLPGNLGDMIASPSQVRVVRARVEGAGIRGRGDEVEELADILADVGGDWRKAANETALGRELGDNVLVEMHEEVLAAAMDAGTTGARGGNIGSSRQMARQLPGDNVAYADFLETDVSTLGRMYFERMPATLEIIRKFGTRDAEDAITDALVKAAGEMDGTAAQISQRLDEMGTKLRYLRDDVLNDIHANNPLTLSRVAVDNLKSYGSVTQLGKVIFSQFAEIARPLMVTGLKRNAEFAMKAALGDKGRFGKAKLDFRITGEGMDTQLGIGQHRFIENGGLNATGSQSAEWLKRKTSWWNDFANGPWYIVNLMSPMTDKTKQWQMMLTAHFAVEDMGRLLNGQLTPKQVRNLAAMGIDEEFARRVLPWTDPSDTGINLLQIDRWPDADARARMLAVIAGEARRSIPTAGPSVKSLASRGFVSMDPERREYPFITLPFQYMTFGMAATQRILVSGLQGRDASGLAGALAVVGFAYLGNYMRTPEHVWDRMPADERWFRAVEMSGILGSISDVNQMVELMSMGTAGGRPMLGMSHPFGGEYDGWDATGVLAGAGGANPVALFRLFTDPTLSDWERASIVRRAVPLNNLFYLDSFARDAQRAAFNAL